MADEWTVNTLKAHFDARFDALQEGVNKADAAYEKRMDNANEFRSTLETQQGTFVTKEQVRWAFTAMLAGGALVTAVLVAISGAG